MTTIQLNKWFVFWKNHIYQLINSGELRSFIYQGARTYTFISRKCLPRPCRKHMKGRPKMTREEKIVDLERMFRNCPEMLSPIKVSRWTPLGKNRVYALIKTGELKSFIYQGAYMIAKTDLIEYLADHSEDEAVHTYHIGKGGK